MAYVMIEGYMCERCHYRWGTRNGTGVRTKPDPAHCPKCKTRYWNLPRRVAISPEKQAKVWTERTPVTDKVA